MLAKILGLVLGLGGGNSVASNVVGGVSTLALAPLAIWFLAHKDEVLATITYAQAGLIAGLVWVVLRAAHVIEPPKAPGQP